MCMSRERCGAGDKVELAGLAGQGHVDFGGTPGVHAQHACLLPGAGRFWLLHLLGSQGQPSSAMS